MRCALCLFGFVILCIVGCGPANKDPLLTGTVTFDGVLLSDGSIAFAEANGGSYDAVIANGRFSLHLPAGEKTVRVISNKITGSVTTQESGNDPVYEQIIPEKYNMRSELKFEVPSSGGTANFELTSGKGVKE